MNGGAGTLDGTHGYADDGIFTVEVCVTDNHGAIGCDTLSVTVNNVAPTVEAGSDKAVKEGDIVNLPPGAFTDPGILDVHTAVIDWGDGTLESGQVGQAPGSGTVAGAQNARPAGDGCPPTTTIATPPTTRRAASEACPARELSKARVRRAEANVLIVMIFGV